MFWHKLPPAFISTHHRVHSGPPHHLAGMILRRADFEVHLKSIFCMLGFAARQAASCSVASGLTTTLGTPFGAVPGPTCCTIDAARSPTTKNVARAAATCCHLSFRTFLFPSFVTLFWESPRNIPLLPFSEFSLPLCPPWVLVLAPARLSPHPPTHLTVASPTQNV